MRSFIIDFILCSFIIATNCCTKTKSGIAPFELRCEYAINPLGIESENPRLSWILESDERDQKQIAYQVLAASSEEILKSDKGDIWNSERVESEQSAHVLYNGEKLQSGERYFWKVRVWDKNNRISDWSRTAFWEMGLLNKEDWKGKWIGYDCESAPILRREFTIDKPVVKASVYISGIGYYELNINGLKVGDHVLDPGQTDYEKRVFYVTYDITERIKVGANAIGVILGNGWYHQNVVAGAKFGWGNVDYGKPRLILQLRIIFDDGTETFILSDDNWKAASGPIVFNNIYAGEYYDARLEQTGWDLPGFDDSNWDKVEIIGGPGGNLVSQKLPPIKRISTLKPVNLTNPESGVYVYDLGQNFAGWAKLKNIKAIPGTTIRLRFAESVSENGIIDPASTGVYATNVVQTDKYITKGAGVEEWEPRFTYHGFRYVELTGIQGAPSIDNLEGVVVNSAVDTAGRFECSDEMLNRIHRTALWTMYSNMHSIPTDCPHRERNGWLGDAHLCAEMSIYNMDAPLFWSKFIRDIETSSTDGVPNNIAPGRRTGGTGDESRPDWASASIIIPWYMYLYYGDTVIIAEHWEDMTSLMSHFKSIARNNIINFGYGDMFPPGVIYPEEPPVALTSTAWYYLDTRIMTFLSNVLGKEDESVQYDQLAEGIKNSFNIEFYNVQNKTYGSQTADCLALYLGLTPDSDDTEVASSLVGSIRDESHGHHGTGVVGSRHLYWVLSKYDYGDVALGILHQTTYPGIGDLLNRGATTFWEYWGEKVIDETSAGTRSKSHPFQGAYDVWFYNGIAGINPDQENPGFKNIILQPQIISDIKFTKTQYRSIHGLIKSGWQVNNKTISWSVSIPVNTTATVYVPTDKKDSINEGNNIAANAKGVKFIKMENGNTVFSIGSGDYMFIWEY